MDLRLVKQLVIVERRWGETFKRENVKLTFVVSPDKTGLKILVRERKEKHGVAGTKGRDR